MADLKYVVDVDLNVDPSSASRIGRVGDPIGKLQKEAAKVGSALLGGFEGAVEKVGGLVLGLGKIGVAAGVAAATYGVMGLNQELESTKVSLAAVLNANKVGGGIEQSMGIAADWMRQMKKDARDLPGEFSDLLKIVQSGAGSAFNAGLDVPKFEKLAAQSMAAAKAMSVPMDQAGRELAQLLEGRAGAHNVFGTRLGIHASDFKGKTPEQRVEMITTALGKFEPAIKAFGSTMDAQSSTLLDNAKTFLGAATLPLFNKVKTTIGEANAWFDANRSTVDLYADKIGYALEQAFDKGKAVVMEYGPLLLDWGERAYDKIVRIWQDVEPYVKSVGSEIKEFLSNDAGFDKIKTVLELYIAAKGISGAASAIGFLAPLVKAGAGVLGSAGVGGGIGGAGIGTGAGVALGETAALASSSAILALPLAAIAAAVLATGYEVFKRQTAVETVDHSGDTGFRSKDNQRYIDELGEKGKEAARQIATMDEATYQASLDLPPGFSAAADAAQEFAHTMHALSKSGDWDKVGAMADEALDAEFKAKHRAGLVYETVADEAGRWEEIAKSDFMVQNSFNTWDMKAKDQAEAKRKADAAREKAGKGAGGTVIHKVEVSVSTNQNPGQVARMVGSFLAHSSRFRTSSPYTRSFTSPGTNF